MVDQRYDTIGRGYTANRRPDPRIEAQVWSAIGGASRIVNVGAGTGSYEAAGRAIVGVEPSQVMISQRGPLAAPVIRAAAEVLPFADHSFDLAMAMMTIHHWANLRAGLTELCRVARRQVIFTFDPDMHDRLWVFNEYVPEALGLADAAPLEVVAEIVGASRVEVVPTPADCTDGFASAYWRRPEQYLSPSVRAGISAFARLDPAEVEAGMARLERDLASGAWHQRHADLLQLDSIDAGLRLVVAGAG
jgi:SAM-dependent methyltransferase